MPKNSLNVSLKGADDIFSTEESRQEQQREQVQQIPIGELFPFKNHPFKVLDDESMQRTVESVEQYPFISYLSDLLAKSKPSDDAVKKLHDCIDKVAVALGHDSTDVFRALLAKLIEEPEEKQTFDRLLEMAEKFAAKHE